MSEGQGTSNGVNYAYQFRSTDLFGVFECQVNRTLLDTPGKTFRSIPFKIGHYVWALELKHKGDGHLGAYLTSLNDTSVFVHRSFTLVNNIAHKDNKSSGNLSKMGPFDSRGSHRLATIAKTKDQNSGFLSGNIFWVKMEVRMKLPSNEQCTSCCTDQSATFIWKLKHPRQGSPWKLVSSTFQFREREWALQLFPGGRDESRGRSSIYLHPSKGQALKVRFRFSILDPRGKNDLSKRTLYKFGSSGDGYGFTDFVREEVFLEESEGYLQNGWVTLMMHLILDDDDADDDRSTSPPKLSTPLQERREETDVSVADCVVCMANPQTHGVLHGNTMHRCLCYDCSTILERERNTKCPICMTKIDRIIRVY